MEPLTTTANKWTFAEKILFRFFFCFLGIHSLICYNIFFAVFYSWEKGFYKMGELLAVFSKPLAWLDKQIYHIGYKHGDITFYQDNRYAWVIIITLFILSILMTIVWSLVDKKRVNYNRLHYWFIIYLVLHLCLAMIFYAAIKIIPLQMPWPNVEELLKPFGDSDKFWQFWNLMGVVPAYSRFMGICELVATLLVIYHRTRILGCLFLTVILGNVVCYNIFFNVPVKMSAIYLLVVTLFLLAPFASRLFHFFYYQQAVSLKEKNYAFTTPWKRYLLNYAFFFLLLWVAFRRSSETISIYNTYVKNRKLERLYTVNSFVIEKDTIPPLLTDTIRWKRLAFTDYPKEENYALVYNMQDKKESFNYIWDSSGGQIQLISKDSLQKIVFNYYDLNESAMKLEGKWKGNSVSMILNRVNIDSMNIKLKKTTWVRQF